MCLEQPAEGRREQRARRRTTVLVAQNAYKELETLRAPQSFILQHCAGVCNVRTSVSSQLCVAIPLDLNLVAPQCHWQGQAFQRAHFTLLNAYTPCCQHQASRDGRYRIGSRRPQKCNVLQTLFSCFCLLGDTRMQLRLASILETHTLLGGPIGPSDLL